MVEPLRILIVDDEPLAIERLRLLCAAIEGLVVVGTCHDGPSLLEAPAASRPDLVLLDIAMPGMTGIEVARRLEATRALVVFVTALDGHALDAFEVAAVDYLLKPVEPARLQRVIARARAFITRPTEPPPRADCDLWVRNRGEMIKLPLLSIDVVEAERDYVRLHHGQDAYLLHHTISALEARLDPARFLRIHRSTIVRRDHITRLTPRGAGHWAVELGDGRRYPVGGSYLPFAKALFSPPKPLETKSSVT